jgi:hypothetical protein
MREGVPRIWEWLCGVRRRGEEVATPGALPLDHAGQRLPGLGVDRVRFLLQLPGRPCLLGHNLSQPLLVQCVFLPSVCWSVPAVAGMI